MHQQSKSSLVQIMACRLIGTKPLPEPMIYCQLDPENTFQRHIIRNSEIFTQENEFGTSSAKWRPFCPSLDVLMVMAYSTAEWIHLYFTNLLCHFSKCVHNTVVWKLKRSFCIGNKNWHVGGGHFETIILLPSYTFYTRPVLTFGYCRCLYVCVCVHVSISRELSAR